MLRRFFQVTSQTAPELALNRKIPSYRTISHTAYRRSRISNFTYFLMLIDTTYTFRSYIRFRIQYPPLYSMYTDPSSQTGIRKESNEKKKEKEKREQPLCRSNICINSKLNHLHFLAYQDRLSRFPRPVYRKIRSR